MMIEFDRSLIRRADFFAPVRAAWPCPLIHIGAFGPRLPRARKFFDDVGMFCRQVVALNPVGGEVI